MEALGLAAVTAFVVVYVSIMGWWLWMDNDEHEMIKQKAVSTKIPKWLQSTEFVSSVSEEPGRKQ